MIVRHAESDSLGSVDTLFTNSLGTSPNAPYLLASCDAQAANGYGVTLAVSLMERRSAEAMT